MTLFDMSIQPGEILVTVDGSVVFPAIAAVDEGRLIPRFRPAIAARLVKWTETNHQQDNGTPSPIATWQGHSIKLVCYDGGGGEPGTQVWFHPDHDGNYRIDFWTWREYQPQRRVTDNLLMYATQFTFDRTALGTDAHADADLEVTVTRVRPDEWTVNWNAQVFNYDTGQWDSNAAARSADGATRWAYRAGRTEAVECALAQLARLGTEPAAQ